MVNKKRKSRIIEVCPNCGSADIDYASLETRSGAIIGLGLPEKYYCKDCGYCGSIILEIDEADKDKMGFKHRDFRHEKLRRERLGEKKRSTEVLKPVFITVIVLFFIISLVFTTPRYEVMKEYEPQNFTVIGSMTKVQPLERTTFGQRVAPDVYWLGGAFIKVHNSSLVNVDRALGYGGLAGFLFPLFLLFFVLGFIFLMIYSHWHRVRFFS